MPDYESELIARDQDSVNYCGEIHFCPRCLQHYTCHGPSSCNALEGEHIICDECDADCAWAV